MFTKATKSASRLRLGLCGTSGSGKTYSALAIATALGARVAVVDTEHGSAAKYSDHFDFDVLNLDTFEAEKFTGAIRAAEAAGYDVIVIDSLSHAWMGTGGTLDAVTEAKRRSRNEFTAWRDPSKQHTELIESILHSRMHVIATMRSKTEYVMEEYQGKKVPRKIGMAPVQRDGMEYEFDVVGDMQEGTLVISKTRCSALAGKSFHHPGAVLADTLRGWLGDGPVPEPEPAPAPPAGPSSEATAAFGAVCADLCVNAKNEAQSMLALYELPNWQHATDAHLFEYIELLRQESAAPPVPPPATSEHPLYQRLHHACQRRGIDTTARFLEIMDAHGCVDAGEMLNTRADEFTIALRNLELSPTPAAEPDTAA